MKLHLLLVLAFLTIPPAFSDDLFAESEKPARDPAELGDEVHYRLMVEYYQVPLAEVPAVMSIAGGDPAGLAQVKKLTAEGKAELVDLQLLTGITGEYTEQSSVSEFIYPTEWEPAKLPEKIPTDLTEAKLKELAVGPTPTAFDNRNLGSSIDATVTKTENSTLLADINCTFTHHTGDIVWSEWKNSRGDASVRMPTFYEQKISTSVQTVFHRPVLLGTLSPQGKDGLPDSSKKIFAYLTIQPVSE